MWDRRGSFGLWIIVALVAMVLIGTGVYLAMYSGADHAVSTAPTPASATVPATAPSTAAAPPDKPAEYMDVVRLRYPSFPTTQPLAIPISLPEAARLVIPDPIYLDAIGELWITRADAEPTATVLKDAQQRSTHVLRENVAFVHRWPDESGVWQPQLVCRKPAGGYEIVTRTTRQDLPTARAFEWHRAFSWNDAIVVPSDRGISIIRPDRRPMELDHEFIPPEQLASGKYSPVQFLLDWRGLIAWMPWENEKLGSRGAARFLDGKWTILDSSTGWPEKLLHLVPLLDGSILQLLVNDDKTVDVALAILDPAEVDQTKIAALVEQLSDPDSQKRATAFAELTRWGPGIWPVLEKLLPDQPPEAQVRLGQLLSAKTQPTLGGMLLGRGPVAVKVRGDFGAAVFYSDAGVAIPRDTEQEPALISPAWISIQPGRAIELAPAGIVEAMAVKGRQLSIVRGEWFVNDDVEGPRWWLSNHLSAPLLKGDELKFKQFIGQDGRGRWIFRKSDDAGPSLVIDPTLPDPTPRLPVWVYHVEQGQVGWTRDDWPGIKRGGAWALLKSDWRPIDESKEKFFMASTAPAPAAPATAPATSPATSVSLGPPILVEKDGTRFYDGRQMLRMVARDGRQLDWPLPAETVGEGEVHLLRAGEDRLFLFNAPGRVARLACTPGIAEPFKLEAVFTRRIPNVDHFNRVWLDPAGRLIIAYGGDTLAICFPAGRIPSDIARKMTAQELEEAEDR